MAGGWISGRIMIAIMTLTFLAGYPAKLVSVATVLIRIKFSINYYAGHVEGETHIYTLLANTALERGFIGQERKLTVFPFVVNKIKFQGKE